VTKYVFRGAQNGAYVDKFKNVVFKLFTYDDVMRVFVDIQNKSMHELERVEAGIFKKTLTPENVSIGDKYRFLIERGDGEVVYCKDPYAMKRNSVLDDFSEIYSHHEYRWGDDAWIKNNITQKVSRLASENGLLPINNLKISELHIATLTRKGDLQAAKSHLDKISEDGIFNSIEIMPVENTHSFNWGYDGVDKFTVQEDVLGGPDALKDFIDYAHCKKINVIMDVVPNHTSTDGNMLNKTGPYIDNNAKSPFGLAFNLEHDPIHNKHVRDYLTNMCLNWLENYHCDGLRLDMTKYMDSDYTMKHIAKEVHYHYPDAILIAEDGRNNLYKVTQPLTDLEASVGKSEAEHAKIMEIPDSETSLENLGYDLEWNFPFFHNLYDTVLNMDGVKKLSESIKRAFHGVQYFMSHDEVGNLDGTRFITKIITRRMDMPNKVLSSHETEKYQRAAHATQSILKSKVSGEFDKFDLRQRAAFLRGINVTVDITPKEINNALNDAISEHKVALGNVFATPGPKMLFQGDEAGVLNYFKFFRQLSPIKAKRDTIDLANKGYESGYSAFLDSKMDSINYAPEYMEIMNKIKFFTQTLTKLSDEIPALNSGKVASEPIAHEATKVQGIHLKDGKSETFTVSNFDGFSYDNDYNITFPEGQWEEILNSNSTKYAGSGQFKNKSIIISDGSNKNNISLPGYSMLIFEKIQDARSFKTSR